ncbi:MAG: ABC transporter permease [Clostridiaceae bacterium]|nr:ABC transporter permease [Clostridiaceae bacterium]
MSAGPRRRTGGWYSDPSAVFGIVVTLLVLLLAAAGALGIAGDPEAMDASSRFSPPSLRHLFGTDNFGRDVASRVLAGTAATVSISLGTILIAGTAGTLLGALAGYAGGRTDQVIMRLSDAVFAFPGILLALMIVSIFGPGSGHVVIALGILFTPSFARVVRGGMIQQKSEKYVELARVFGASPARIILVHILPNLSSTLLTAFSVGFANAILAEAGMSYLGLGVQPPDASWGAMLKDSVGDLFRAPWMAVFPGLAIVLAVMGFHALGEAARNAGGGNGHA